LRSVFLDLDSGELIRFLTPSSFSDFSSNSKLEGLTDSSVSQIFWWPRYSGLAMTGYAAAVHPVASNPLHTDEEGLGAGNVSIPAGDSSLPAYFAAPTRTSNAPLILVIQEIFGVHEHIRDLCRRLAKAGYYAIAPELYARYGDVSQIPEMQEIIDRVVKRVPDIQVFQDLDATVEFARTTGRVDAQRLGITGFCWGGRITWLYSAHQLAVRAGVAWYGKLDVGSYSHPSMQPKQPIEVAAELHGAILGLYGGRDEGIPLADVAKMRDAIKRAGKEDRCQIVVYPEAGHAFNADYRASYHAPSAKDAWAKMLVWFEEYL
jgi:carboxymethylenebutenolidase